MLHTHAPVFTPPREHPPAVEWAAEGPDAELLTVERASDVPLEVTSLILEDE